MVDERYGSGDMAISSAMVDDAVDTAYLPSSSLHVVIFRVDHLSLGRAQR
jgi:hypothetical protein